MKFVLAALGHVVQFSLAADGLRFSLEPLTDDAPEEEAPEPEWRHVDPGGDTPHRVHYDGANGVYPEHPFGFMPFVE